MDVVHGLGQDEEQGEGGGKKVERKTGLEICAATYLLPASPLNFRNGYVEDILEYIVNLLLWISQHDDSS